MYISWKQYLYFFFSVNKTVDYIIAVYRIIKLGY